MNHSCPGCSICLICAALPTLSAHLNGAFGVMDEGFNIERVADIASKLNAYINELSHSQRLRTTEVLAAVLALAGFIADTRVLDDDSRARFAQVADELGPLISHYLAKQQEPHPTIH
jgi:hypothetical protein